jgi:ribosome-associated toxin RatA of RatAB toxin-antitoxin module
MPRLKDEKILAYPVTKVFDVAIGVEHYPAILPYVKSVRILSQTHDHIRASLSLGLSMISFAYECEIAYKRNEYISVTSTERLFKKFSSHCDFYTAENDTTRLVYELDCEFVNPIIEILAGGVVPHQTRSTIGAFENYLRKAQRHDQ